jgi:hypothetical protein
MGSSGKRKTTFAKLARESKLRERRAEKQAKREARKQRASENQLTELGGENTELGDENQPEPGDENQPTEVGDIPAGDER